MPSTRPDGRNILNNKLLSGRLVFQALLINIPTNRGLLAEKQKTEGEKIVKV